MVHGWCCIGYEVWWTVYIPVISPMLRLSLLLMMDRKNEKRGRNF